VGTFRLGTERDPVARAVTQFVVASLLVLIVVGLGGVLVLRRVGANEARRRAEDTAVVAARAVQERLTNGIVKRTTSSLLPIDALVTAGVLEDPIEDVSLRLSDGEVVFSNQTELIGTTAPLDVDERAALVGGGPTVINAPTSGGVGAGEEAPSLLVSLPLETPDGTALLFQARLRFDSVAASARQLWTAFLPVLAVTLVALAALEIPLAVRLARRVRDSQRQRERLLRHAIEASDVERRRIAGELHDGLGQQLVGLSMTLSAEADAIEGEDPPAAGRLREAADRTREQMRSLRSALMGIYPPTLERAGLRAALDDLGANLRTTGVEVDIDVPSDLELPVPTEALLFRGAREAMRNIATHAEAGHARIVVSAENGVASLSVHDDGVGFDPAGLARSTAEGHLGLAMLDDLARQAGGSLHVGSHPGDTTVRIEAPLP
jgi:two-component system, NarL family, sensor kinase